MITARRPGYRGARVVLVALAGLVWAAPARAAERDHAGVAVAADADAEVDASVQVDIEPPRPARGLAAMTQPMGMAEFGFGWLTLPGASVCLAENIGCEQGDTSFALDAWQLYRANPHIAAGAGLTLGLLTTTAAPLTEPGVDRDHSRGYFMFELTGRYYPYVGETLEAWGGVTGGLVVVSDRFESKEGFEDRPLVGKRGVTVRTEGYAIGIAAGAAYALAERWSLGGALRYGLWFLPNEPAKDPFGDEASLKGRNTIISVGVSIAYRLPL